MRETEKRERRKPDDIKRRELHEKTVSITKDESRAIYTAVSFLIRIANEGRKNTTAEIGSDSRRQECDSGQRVSHSLRSIKKWKEGQ